MPGPRTGWSRCGCRPWRPGSVGPARPCARPFRIVREWSGGACCPVGQCLDDVLRQRLGGGVDLGAPHDLDAAVVVDPPQAGAPDGRLVDQYGGYRVYEPVGDAEPGG